MPEGTPLHSDRSAWNVIDFAIEHAKDIDLGTPIVHVPSPGADGSMIESDGLKWIVVAGIALANLLDYARGAIIRGGPLDWEAYSAKTLRYFLVGDGNDVISRALQNDDLPNPLALQASSVLTIAAGAITVTKSYHVITSESGTSDDLVTINGGVARQFLLLQATAGHTITIKTGSGNVFINGNVDFPISGDKSILLYYDGTNWSDLGAGGGHIIQDEGSDLAQRSRINFTGDGVTAADVGGVTTVTIPGGGHTIQDEGVDLAQRAKLNFTGTGVTASDVAGVTTVTIPSSGHTIEDEGVALTQRDNLNFKGASVKAEDNAITGATDITIDDADHLHGLFRWVADGSDTIDLPDLAEYVECVSDDAEIVDPATYTLSADRSQVVFDVAPTAASVMTIQYVIARI